MKVIVGPDTVLPVGGMGGSLHSWERGVDPWHANACKGIKGIERTVATLDHGPRKSGWYGCDWGGNIITFVADGEEIDLSPT